MAPRVVRAAAPRAARGCPPGCLGRGGIRCRAGCQDRGGVPARHWDSARHRDSLVRLAPPPGHPLTGFHPACSLEREAQRSSSQAPCIRRHVHLRQWPRELARPLGWRWCLGGRSATSRSRCSRSRRLRRARPAPWRSASRPPPAPGSRAGTAPAGARRTRSTRLRFPGSPSSSGRRPGPRAGRAGCPPLRGGSERHRGAVWRAYRRALR